MDIPSHLKRFLSPEAPPEVRLTAAKGLFPMVPRDTVISLFVLTGDPDQEVSQTARKSLCELPRQTILTAIQGDLARPIVEAIAHLRGDDSLLGGAAPQVVEPKPARPVVKEHAFTPDLTVEREKATEVERLSLYKKIEGMTVAEKIKLALLGNKEVRDILIKDSNKLVALTVLKNPRITEDEVLKTVNSRNISDEVLREVANNREWLKKYPVRLGLVTNPRTPVGISLRQLGYLQEKDLQHLARSKNIPTTLATSAKNLLMQKERH
ncbi:MAG: hypothetical protein HY878_01075 [Deltaproteobacteria bacterium]|nr:hypothetical protein [Deltaproteobacteria bacterium]